MKNWKGAKVRLICFMVCFIKQKLACKWKALKLPMLRNTKQWFINFFFISHKALISLRTHKKGFRLQMTNVPSQKTITKESAKENLFLDSNPSDVKALAGAFADRRASGMRLGSFVYYALFIFHELILFQTRKIKVSCVGFNSIMLAKRQHALGKCGCNFSKVLWSHPQSNIFYQ